jgi:hypothetical protein
MALNVPDTDTFVDKMLADTTFDAVKLVNKTFDKVLEFAIKLLAVKLVITELLPVAFV